MTGVKSEQERAFLRDLYVATDWGERFAGLVDEHLKLPREGRVLYVAAGTGGHAMALRKAAGDDVEMVCVDESEPCLDLARSKARALGLEAEFQCDEPDVLSRFGDSEFDLVVGDGSLVAPHRLPGMLAEMARVVNTGGQVALGLATASSFGEFFSIFWEALNRAELSEYGTDVEDLISALPTVSIMEDIAASEGLVNVQSWTRVEEFDYGSGDEFLASPLITDFLLPEWLASLPAEASARARDEIARVVDEERAGGSFTISVKATLVTGRKLGSE